MKIFLLTITVFSVIIISCSSKHVTNHAQLSEINGAPKMVVEHEQLLSEIQVEYSSYSSRLGVTQVI